MENIYRNVYSGEVDITYVGKEVRVAGWINSIRKLGGLTFVTLRDETGIVQIITEDADMFKGITRESTVTITGTVKLRTEDMINPNMKQENRNSCKQCRSTRRMCEHFTF